MRREGTLTITGETALALPSLRRPGLRRGKTRMLAAGDGAALVLAYALSFGAAEAIGPLPAVSAPPLALVLLGLVVVPVWLAVFTAYHLYENDSLRISAASFDEVRDVFHAMLACSLAFLIVSQGLRFAFGWWIYEPVEAALFCATALVLVPVARGTLRTWVFPRVMEPRRALIVGTGEEALLVHRKLQGHPEYGIEVVGFLGDDTADDEAGVPGPVLGAPHEIGRIIDAFEVDRVLLTSSVTSHEEMLDLIRNLRIPQVQISIVPRYSEIFTSHATLDDVEGMPVVTLPQLRLGRSSRLLKRTVDLVVSSLVLLVLAPVLAAVAIAIRLDSPGKAIYRQPRRGRNGSTFSIAKFRTMSVGAEQRRSEVFSLNEVDGPLFKIKQGDPRVTRVGAFLRKTSLDELPQLWNVLRGDMSLVGPRPFVLYEADQITGWAERRLDMTPGITGLWQVLGRNDIPFEEMCKLDYLYVTNWSLWWDLKILCQTIPTVLMGRGAY